MTVVQITTTIKFMEHLASTPRDTAETDFTFSSQTKWIMMSGRRSHCSSMLDTHTRVTSHTHEHVSANVLFIGPTRRTTTATQSLTHTQAHTNDRDRSSLTRAIYHFSALRTHKTTSWTQKLLTYCSLFVRMVCIQSTVERCWLRPLLSQTFLLFVLGRW